MRAQTLRSFFSAPTATQERQQISNRLSVISDLTDYVQVLGLIRNFWQTTLHKTKVRTVVCFVVIVLSVRFLGHGYEILHQPSLLTTSLHVLPSTLHHRKVI